jgi:MinD-like ATPase involved in chromosome partitioning or flagellar assembly
MTLRPDTGDPVPVPSGRVIFTEGGKGGVGKTAFMAGLVGWFEARQIPYALLDLDTENKVRGSLTHYFPQARKVDIHTPEGLNAVVEAVTPETPIVLADLGAGSGHVVHEWFRSAAERVAEKGVVFTAVSVITPDPPSVESVLRWASELQRRVDYLVVKNVLHNPPDFSHWEQNPKAEQFRQFFRPQEMEVEYRAEQFETLMRHFGVTVGQAADRKVNIPELQQASVVLRAQAYRRHLFAELNRVKGCLLL